MTPKLWICFVWSTRIFNLKKVSIKPPASQVLGGPVKTVNFFYDFYFFL